MHRPVRGLAQREIAGSDVRTDLTRDIAGKAPSAGKKFLRPAGRDIAPVDVVLGRAGEHHGEADRVDAVHRELI